MRLNPGFVETPTRGFTLVEVLVAMLTLAIGLAGNYLMFARSMQQQQHGTYQGRAVIIARGVAADLGAGRVALLASPAACNAGDATACAALARLSATDRRWQPIVAARLPRGVLRIQGAGTGTVTISVGWQDVLSLQASAYRLTVTSP